MIVFIKAGVFRDLESEVAIEPNSYAVRNGFDPKVFVPMCEYLYSLGILDKHSSKLRLSYKGRHLSSTAVGIFDLLYAYSPIFQNLEDLLTGKMTYGTDVVRFSDFVAKGSTAITRYLPFPAAMKLLQKHGYRSVMDMGCGDGAFLFFIESAIEHGIGIDLAPIAIASATEKARNRKLDSKLSFHTADIFELLRYPELLHFQTELISLMFVLHEFLYSGEHRVISLLNQIKDGFPKAHILICELCESDVEDLRKNPTAICEHHLYHRLSQQGFATAKEWIRIFELGGYKLKDQTTFNFAEQGYFIFEPKLRDNAST
jgi:SAM-dependent methyltransferase